MPRPNPSRPARGDLLLSLALPFAILALGAAASLGGAQAMIDLCLGLVR